MPPSSGNIFQGRVPPHYNTRAEHRTPKNMGPAGKEGDTGKTGAKGIAGPTGPTPVHAWENDADKTTRSLERAWMLPTQPITLGDKDTPFHEVFVQKGFIGDTAKTKGIAFLSGPSVTELQSWLPVPAPFTSTYQYQKNGLTLTDTSVACVVPRDGRVGDPAYLYDGKPVVNTSLSIGTNTSRFEHIYVKRQIYSNNTLYVDDLASGQTMSLSYDLVRKQTMNNKGTNTILNVAMSADDRQLSVDMINFSGLTFGAFLHEGVYAIDAGASADDLAGALTRTIVRALVQDGNTATTPADSKRAVSKVMLRERLNGQFFVTSASNVVEVRMRTPRIEGSSSASDTTAIQLYVSGDDPGEPSVRHTLQSFAHGFPAAGSFLDRSQCFIPNVQIDAETDALEVHWFYFSLEYDENSVLTPALATNAVREALIAENAVTVSELGDLAVASTQLASGAVTTESLSSSSAAVVGAALTPNVVSSSAVAAATMLPAVLSVDEHFRRGGEGVFTNDLLRSLRLLSSRMWASAEELNRAAATESPGIFTERTLDADAVQSTAIVDGSVSLLKLDNLLQTALQAGPAGMQGPKGTQGEPGAAGPVGAGVQGAAGDAGFRGRVGPDGSAGMDGDAGEQGVEGRPGDVGDASGSSGPQGSKGEPGDVGPPGASADPQSAPGVQGVAGDEGPAGPRGSFPPPELIFPGAQGPAGPQGETGTVFGAQGSPGAQGVQGSSGVQGPPTAGTEGPQGVPGVAGPRGKMGKNGLVGASGPPGVQGPQGDTSLVAGPQGDAGPMGYTGVTVVGGAGPQGFAGAQGDAGYGQPGNDGAPGPQGVAGAAGSAGVPGADAVSADAGPQGVAGVQGSQGEPASDLLPGPQGVPGDPGVSGPAGVSGPPGEAGVQGEIGIGTQGDTGADGPQGPVGDAPEFAGDQGPAGTPGLDGPAGFDGPAGESGTAGVAGEVGVQGPQGDNWGALHSPEEAALLFGGPQGVQGMANSDGAGIGAQGPAGPPGVTGPQADTLTYTGPQGFAGLQGKEVTGARGPQGVVGANDGPAGPAGVQGVPGPRGVQGPDSDPGPAGPQGDNQNIVRGPRGVTGNAGPQGPTGPPGFSAYLGPLLAAAWVGPQGDASTETGPQGDTGNKGFAPGETPLFPSSVDAPAQPIVRSAAVAAAVVPNPNPRSAVSSYWGGRSAAAPRTCIFAGDDAQQETMVVIDQPSEALNSSDLADQVVSTYKVRDGHATGNRNSIGAFLDADFLNARWTSTDADADADFQYDIETGDYIGSMLTMLDDGTQLAGEFVELELPHPAVVDAVRIREGARVRGAVIEYSPGVVVYDGATSLPLTTTGVAAAAAAAPSVLDPELGREYAALVFPGSMDTPGEQKLYTITIQNPDFVPLSWLAVGGGGGAKNNVLLDRNPRGTPAGGGAGEVVGRNVVLRSSQPESAQSFTFHVIVGGGGRGVTSVFDSVAESGFSTYILCPEDPTLHFAAQGGGGGADNVRLSNGKACGVRGGSAGGCPTYALGVDNLSGGTLAAANMNAAAQLTVAHADENGQLVTVRHCGGDTLGMDVLCGGGASGQLPNTRTRTAGAGICPATDMGPEFACMRRALYFGGGGGGGGGDATNSCVHGGAGGGGGGAWIGNIQGRNGAQSWIDHPSLDPTMMRNLGVDGWQLALRFSCRDKPCSAIAISDDGAWMVVGDMDGKLFVSNSLGQARTEVPVGSYVGWENGFKTYAARKYFCAAVSRSGDFMAVGRLADVNQGSAAVISTNFGQSWTEIPADQLPPTTTDVRGAVVVPGSSSSPSPGTVLFWDGQTTFFRVTATGTDSGSTTTTTTTVPCSYLLNGDEPANALDLKYVRMRANRATGKYIYCAAGTARFFRSDDFGSPTSWTNIATTIDATTADIDFSCVAVSDDGAVVYAAARTATNNLGKIYKSTDFGVTWSVTAADPVPSATAPLLASDLDCSADGQVVLLVTQSVGVFRSPDAGASWIVSGTDASSITYMVTKWETQTIDRSSLVGLPLARGCILRDGQAMVLACTEGTGNSRGLLHGGASLGHGRAGAPCSGGGGGSGSTLLLADDKPLFPSLDLPFISPAGVNHGGSGVAVLLIPKGYIAEIRPRTVAGGGDDQPLTEIRPFVEDATMPFCLKFADIDIYNSTQGTKLVRAHSARADGASLYTITRAYHQCATLGNVDTTERVLLDGQCGFRNHYQHFINGSLNNGVWWTNNAMILYEQRPTACMSLSIWLRRPLGFQRASPYDYCCLLRNGSTGERMFLGYEYNSQAVRVYCEANGQARQLDATVPDVDGLWHHYVWVLDVDGWQLYRDGVLTGSFLQADLPAGGLFPRREHAQFMFLCGNQDNNQYLYYGQVSETRMYTRALSSDDARLLYSLRAPELAVAAAATATGSTTAVLRRHFKVSGDNTLIDYAGGDKNVLAYMNSGEQNTGQFVKCGDNTMQVNQGSQPLGVPLIDVRSRQLTIAFWMWTYFVNNNGCNEGFICRLHNDVRGTQIGVYLERNSSFSYDSTVPGIDASGGPAGGWNNAISLRCIDPSVNGGQQCICRVTLPWSINAYNWTHVAVVFTSADPNDSGSTGSAGHAQVYWNGVLVEDLDAAAPGSNVSAQRPMIVPALPCAFPRNFLMVGDWIGPFFLDDVRFLDGQPTPDEFRAMLAAGKLEIPDIAYTRSALGEEDASSPMFLARDDPRFSLSVPSTNNTVLQLSWPPLNAAADSLSLQITPPASLGPDAQLNWTCDPPIESIDPLRTTTVAIRGLPSGTRDYSLNFTAHRSFDNTSTAPFNIKCNTAANAFLIDGYPKITDPDNGVVEFRWCTQIDGVAKLSWTKTPAFLSDSGIDIANPSAIYSYKNAENIQVVRGLRSDVQYNFTLDVLTGNMNSADAGHRALASPSPTVFQLPLSDAGLLLHLQFREEDMYVDPDTQRRMLRNTSTLAVGALGDVAIVGDALTIDTTARACVFPPLADSAAAVASPCYLELPPIQFLLPPNDNNNVGYGYTIAMRIKLESNDVYNLARNLALWSYARAADAGVATSGPLIELSSNSNKGVYASTEYVSRFSGDASIRYRGRDLTEWQHLAFAYYIRTNYVGVRVYLNGVQVADGTTAIPYMVIERQEFYQGFLGFAPWDAARTLVGAQIGALRMYSRVLTDKELSYVWLR